MAQIRVYLNEVMKKIRDFFNRLMKRSDLLIHFNVGANISFAVTNIFAMTAGGDILTFVIMSAVGAIAAFISGVVKENIDEVVDWDDIIATTLGGLVPAIVNTIGYICYVLLV